MKKMLALIIGIIMLFCYLPSNVLALDDKPEEIIIYEDEIKNADISIQGDDIITLTTIEQTETLMSARMTYNNDEPIKAATVTTVALVVNNPEDTYDVYSDLLAAPNLNHDYRTNSDAASALRIYCTVYFTTQTVDGSDWYRLIRVTGGNNKSNPNSHVIGSGFVISNQHIQYGVWGRNLEGMPPLTNTWFSSFEPENKADSFEIDVEGLHSNWPTVSESQSILGATYTVTIHSVRDNSDKTLEIVNNPLSSVDIPIEPD